MDMPLYLIVLLTALLFLGAYFTYGRFLAKHFGLDPSCQTPAEAINDGVDFVPAEKKYLLGQHFSAIAAAGPIVGPILACLYFGWLPVLLWIVLGAIFFGAVHDFSSLAGSVKHKAVSVVDMMQQYLGKSGHVLFLVFVWLSLLYVITAFTDLTSTAFVDKDLGGATASSSMMYLFLGVLMGLALSKGKMPLKWATPLFLLLVLASIALGPKIPIYMPAFAGDPKTAWNITLLAYCFIASLVPVWILLQPRGYLGGFFLYGTLIFGLIGLFLGGERIQYPAFIGFTSDKGQMLFPILFVTVACGACSGFHGIVCSGTTSKQISKEPDCHLVGYGGMLLEGIVAVLSLATVMVLAKGEAGLIGSPDRIYGEGLSRFVHHLGIPLEFARSFALLAFATFIYDTLDVATRLARQIFQELLGLKNAAGRIMATVASLAIPLICISLKITDKAGQVVPAWKVFWTIFGTSNQLLAALTLMLLSLWLKKTGKAWYLAAIPMVFMLVMTFWSLILMIFPWAGATSFVACVLMGIASLLLIKCIKPLIFRPIP
jgi:carbon starvation protein